MIENGINVVPVIKHIALKKIKKRSGRRLMDAGLMYDAPGGARLYYAIFSFMAAWAAASLAIGTL